MQDFAIIGYSGHAYVMLDSLIRAGATVRGYFDLTEKENNPYALTYLGQDTGPGMAALSADTALAVCIGDNATRRQIQQRLGTSVKLIPIIDALATVSKMATVGNGTFISNGASVGPLAKIGIGCIINTRAVVEHECQIGEFSHVAPGAVLAGRATVGAGSFIGANSTVRDGINIGENVIVGAGAVVVSDVADNSTVVGNPARQLVRPQSLTNLNARA